VQVVVSTQVWLLLSQYEPFWHCVSDVQLCGTQTPRESQVSPELHGLPELQPQLATHLPVAASQNPLGQSVLALHVVPPGGTQVERESQTMPFVQSLFLVQ
jgi:hypothetical protein